MTRAGLAAVCGLVCITACAPSDERISKTVRGRMTADEHIRPYDLNVMTHNKIVTLTGTVDSSAAREAAARVARETNGVIDVINRLRISDTAATAGSLER